MANATISQKDPYIQRTINECPGRKYFESITAEEELVQLARLAQSKEHPQKEDIKTVISATEVTLKQVANTKTGEVKIVEMVRTVQWFELNNGEYLKMIPELKFGLPTTPRQLGAEIIDFLNQGLQ